EPKIAANEVMIITRLHPVLSANADTLCERLVAANDHPGIAGGAEILGRIKAEGSHLTDCSSLRFAVSQRILSAERLRRIFDHFQPKAAGNREHCVHVAAKAVKMNGNNRANAIAFRRAQNSVIWPARSGEVRFQCGG